jgi:hypothetical protein
MTGHGAKFERKKEEAIIALLSHRTIDEAANAIGIAPRTLLRWLQIPEFRAEYFKARREVVSQALARLQQATGAASITILKLMTDPNVPASVKLRAAEGVFALALKGIETEDIDARVSELERAAEEASKKR